MAIYQNSNGQFGVDWRDADGRRHRQQVGSREAAEAVEAKIKEQERSRPQITAAAMTITEAAEIYLAQLNASERTRDTYAAAFRKISEQLAEQRLDKLSARDISEWQLRNTEQYGPNTTNLRTGMLKRLFRWLEENQYGRDLAAQLRAPKKQLGKFHILDYEEEAKLLAAAQPRIRLRVLLALDAGFSLQDAAGVRRSHWNAERGLLLYTRHKTNANATVPTTPRLQKALTPLRGMPAGALLTATHQLRRQTDALSNLRDRTGVQFTSHDLRRTFATRLAAAETNPIVIASLLGHRTTWAVQMAYVHPTEEMLREAILRMSAANPNCWEEPEPEAEAEENPALDPEQQNAKPQQTTQNRIDR